LLNILRKEYPDMEKRGEIYKVGVLKTDLVRQTPRRSGRAARGWKQDKNSVSNDVPYIGRLDRGYSNQKPRGFTKQSIRKTIRKTSRSIR
jgi:hypothetical protein